jgi:hypothetical protein
MRLRTDNLAVVEGRTKYPSTVYDPSDYRHSILKPSTNKKLGKRVEKGRHRGRPFYTLTLEERATCDRACEHWLDCYGNNMPFAHRFKAGDALIRRLQDDLDKCDRKHPGGYLVRLHILGDFFSTEYVDFWAEQLQNRPTLFIYGYTRHHPGTPIGDKIAHLVAQFPDRFSVRFSMLPNHNFSANNAEIAPEVSVTCPVQTGATESCGTCGLCWTAKLPITFLNH